MNREKRVDNEQRKVEKMRIREKKEWRRSGDGRRHGKEGEK